MRTSMRFCGMVLVLVSLTSAWPLSATQFTDDRLIAGHATPQARTQPRGKLDQLIHHYAGRYRVDPALVKAVIHAESGFRARARSHKGARGLMQVMPRTGRFYGARDLDDPSQNLRAGIKHLRYLLDRHRNDLRLALAAYNAGSTAVKRYGTVPPYPETRRYVAKVLRYRGHYQAQMKTANASVATPARG